MAKSKKETNSPPALAVFRVMSDEVLVNSAAFDKLTVADRGKTFASINANAGDTPVRFVANFNDIANPQKLRDELLEGKDVSRRLEFLDIQLEEKEVEALSAFGSILEKIGAVVPPYPWKVKDNDDFSTKINVTSTKLSSNGYSMGHKKFKMIWKHASRFWLDGTQTPRITHRHSDGYYSSRTRTVTITETGVKIGCQSFTRAEVEWIAKKLKVEPSTI